jgi:ABC-2 type transport system permease protein
MTPHKLYISVSTIVFKEINRFLRVWSQTLLPAVVTTALYFIIFGTFIGSQIKPMDGLTYMQFIVPGLAMMAIINASFMGTVSSFYFSKFQRNLEEILVSPMPVWGIVMGFVLGGMARGLAVGIIVLCCALFFTTLPLTHIGIVILFAFLTAIVFALAGLINAVYAKNFDGISIFPNFVLTPLTYLGGVFYSVNLLPPFWRDVSMFNPVLYVINGFRYGLVGVSDVSIWLATSVLLVTICTLFIWVTYLFKSGKGMKM